MVFASAKKIKQAYKNVLFSAEWNNYVFFATCPQSIEVKNILLYKTDKERFILWQVQ